MLGKNNKIFVGGIVLAAALAMPIGIDKIYAAQMMDGVMGQSIEDETAYGDNDRSLDEVIRSTMKQRTPYAMYGASDYDEYIAEAWTTEGEYTDATYYHRSEYESYELFNGIDVSWWQGGGKGSTKSNINWEKAHAAGIDYVFVRVASRDTADGSLYEDTSADAHIQGAWENDINVGLYVFSQALDEEEVEEEAQYVLDLIDEYGWDVTMPIVLDREAGSFKRLTAGKLSKEEETDICNAFSEVILDAGYQPMVYASASWMINYMDLESIEDNGCKIWLARYNNSTDKPVGKLTYPQLADINYEFWQFTSTGKVSGYSGNLDVDFWYKDTNIKTDTLKVTENTTDSIKLKWSSTEDADGYRLYRYDEDKEKYVAVKSVTKTSYTDTGLTAGETYQYKVRCYWTIGGNTYYGDYSDVTEAYTLPAQVENFAADGQSSTSITLGWDETNGATGYRIYQYNEDTEKFEKIIDVADGEITSHQVAGLAGAKEYQFKIRAFRTLADGTKLWGATSPAYKTVTKPRKVAELVVAPVSSGSMTLKWSKVGGATGYQIYRLNPDTGKYEKIATIRDNSAVTYTDTGLTGATKYSYKVRAYFKYEGTNYYGSCSNVKSCVTKPNKITGLKLSTKSSSVTLKWNEEIGVTGYQIYRLNSKTGKYEKIATIRDDEVSTYKDKDVKKGKTYTYKVRAYVKYEGKNYYGTCSSKTKIKVK